MMAKQSPLSFLHDLQMPLRDALRGVATLADATEEALEPAAQLFPEPLRTQFRHALEALDRVGKRLVHAPITVAQIDSAAQFLTGDATDTASAETCASVLVFAWEHLDDQSAKHRPMISETIVADRMRRVRGASQATGVDFAAAALIDLRRSSAIGMMPGLARGSSAAEAPETDLALLTIGVWLLTGRAGSMAEEEKLLDLSMALVRALRDNAATAFADPSGLARFLEDTSKHL